MISPDAFDLDAWLVSTEQSPPIVQAGAAVLRRRAAEVPSALLGTPALLRLLDLMVDVMRAAPGVGLAAPQIGVPLRIYVAEDQAERLANASPEALAVRKRGPLPLMAFINPTVTLAEGDPAIFFEGCLSVRGYGALVPRAASVRVDALDPQGAPFALDLQGWPARIMQHEMDHLNGTLYVDRMLTRSLAADTALAELSGVPVSDVIKMLVDRDDER
jgi:peptide deformylase